MMAISNAEMASTMRRTCGGTRSMTNTMPTFSPRASALAAPKKLDPTISPRAISSDHSTGALNRERSVTEPMTTARTAATASVKPSSRRSGGRRLASGADVAVTTGGFLGGGRLDLVYDRLGVRVLLDEALGLRRDALLERGLVALADRDAFGLEQFERLLLDSQTVTAGIGGGLLRGGKETVARLCIHFLEGRIAEIDRQRREIVFGQRIEFGCFVELAGDDGRWIVL